MKGSKGKEFWIILIGGGLLSFNAGHLNGTTLLQDHPTTTTHMTGNSTNLGISIAELDQKKILFFSLLILCYIFGSFISGLLIPYQSFSISLGYGRVFLLVSIILTISALIDIISTSSFVAYDLLVACAAGLQNGMVSRYSGNILRIGHVTGTCTDIGVNVGRYLMGTKDNLWRIQILIVLLVTFFFGGYIAQKLHHHLGKYQLLLSAGISFFIGISYILYLRISTFRLTFIQSIFGIQKSYDPMRDSVENNMDLNSEIHSVISYEYSAIDDDYNLTQEQARKLHCKTTGELLDGNVKSRGNHNYNNDFDNSLNDDVTRSLLSGTMNYEPDDDTTQLITATTGTIGTGTGTTGTVSTDEERFRLTSANIKLLNQPPPAPPVPPVLHPLQKRNPTEFTLILAGSMLFALNAGIINSITANSTRGFFVSHCTGAASNAGLKLGSEHYGKMSIYITLIFSFMFGSFLVGLMVPSSVFRLGISYTRVFIFEGVLLAIAAIVHINDSSSLYFYYICSCACGVQNAIVTKYSGGILRTTHPTGGLTDIGSILGRMVTGHYVDLWQLKVLIPLVLCFITGGIIGTGLYRGLGIFAIFFNVGFIFFVSFWYLVYLKTVSRTELTYMQLLFGKYTYPFVDSIRKTFSSMKSSNFKN